MDRFFIPRLGLLIVAGLATLLIGVVVLRNPDTHGNLWNQIKPGYTRTAVATLDGEVVPEIPPSRIALEVPRSQMSSQNLSRPGEGASPMDPGRRVYLEAGCPTCHGLDARGSVVGAALAGAIPEIAKNVVRNGPGGMPIFTKANLSDADLDSLTSYLKGLKTTGGSPEELDALKRLSFDPSVPVGVLLEGKAVLRKSCGACHAPPRKEEIRGGFDVGSLLVEMARIPNLSPEDAKLLAYYLMAIRNDVDPVRLP